MTQSKKFAVTGGMGSGKSAVLKSLAQRGYPVFSCDEISRSLWEERAYRLGLLEIFPSCKKGDDIDKKALSGLVFSNEAALRRLEAYAHPRIMERLFADMGATSVAFAEVPLLFEKGYEKDFDGVIVVWRERDARIASIKLRDGLSEEAISARMNNQYDWDSYPREQCLVNDGSLQSLEEKLDGILQTFALPERLHVSKIAKGGIQYP